VEIELHSFVTSAPGGGECSGRGYFTLAAGSMQTFCRTGQSLALWGIKPLFLGLAALDYFTD
jgi:hypothetical protein